MISEGGLCISQVLEEEPRLWQINYQTKCNEPSKIETKHHSIPEVFAIFGLLCVHWRVSTSFSSRMMSGSCESDDRETPLVAVQDLSLIVSVLFRSTLMSDIRIYDPYYCKGGIVKSLSSCGFDESKIFNEDKDCYVVQKKKEVPLNDMIVTNPPYSGGSPWIYCFHIWHHISPGDHIRRAIHYAGEQVSRRALLMHLVYNVLSLCHTCS